MHETRLQRGPGIQRAERMLDDRKLAKTKLTGRF